MINSTGMSSGISTSVRGIVNGVQSSEVTVSCVGTGVGTFMRCVHDDCDLLLLSCMRQPVHASSHGGELRHKPSPWIRHGVYPLQPITTPHLRTWKDA